MRTAAGGTHGYSENWLRGAYGFPHTELGRIMAGWLCVGVCGRVTRRTKLLRELVSKAQKREDRAEALSPVLLVLIVAVVIRDTPDRDLYLNRLAVDHPVNRAIYGAEVLIGLSKSLYE